MSIITADIYDERGKELQSLWLQMRSFGAQSSFHGFIRTVRCFEDNALLKQTLHTPGDGAVLVIDGGGSLEHALVGDVIGKIASDSGWAGLIINGVIRDQIAINALPLGIKALGTNPQKSSKTGEGEVDVEVTFGGVTFRPGVHLYSDEDGVLVER